jgi:hypothetical protein
MAPPDSEQTSEACPFCGASIAPGSVRCGGCGRTLPFWADDATKPVVFSHRGSRYALGFDDARCALWDLLWGGPPLHTEPKTDDGWRSIWKRYVSLEARDAGDVADERPRGGRSAPTSAEEPLPQRPAPRTAPAHPQGRSRTGLRVAVAVLVLCLVAGIASGIAYPLGRDRGEDTGFALGFSSGREEGHREGLLTGREEGREKGRHVGFRQGTRYGRTQGLDQGREEGARRACQYLFRNLGTSRIYSSTGFGPYRYYDMSVCESLALFLR